MAPLYTHGINYKTRMRREINGIIVNQTTLMQSICNSVSNGTIFVMLKCLVSKPYNTKFSIWYCSWRLLEQSVVF